MAARIRDGDVITAQRVPTEVADGNTTARSAHRIEYVASQEPGTRNRLLLLDGHSLAYRAFFALPIDYFPTTTGQPTNAVYGFTAMLINVLRDEKPTHVAVAFDRVSPRSGTSSGWSTRPTGARRPRTSAASSA